MMGIVKDIVGYRIANEIVCLECMESEDYEELTQDQAITQDELNQTDDTYFCDRCKKQL